METRQILEKLPKFINQIDLQSLQGLQTNETATFTDQDFSITFKKYSDGIIRYVAKFITPHFNNFYYFVITHKSKRNKYGDDGIEILENGWHFSYIEIQFSTNMRRISRLEFDKKLDKLLTRNKSCRLS